MRLIIDYKASTDLAITPTYPEGKAFADIVDACFVLKNDKKVLDENAPLLKNMLSGIVKNETSQKLVVSISVDDFNGTALNTESCYSIGLAFKFVNDPKWYRADVQTYKEVRFEYPEINK